MPLFFVGYALAVWWTAARYRRTPIGFAVVLLGFLGLMALNLFHVQLGRWTEGSIYLPVLQSLMYPYTGFVTVIGAYIACLPRRLNRGCEACGYDLHGLATAAQAARCPECGTINKPIRRVYRPSGIDRDNLARSDAPQATSALPPHQIQPANTQEQQRNTGDEAPAERQQSPV